MDLTPFKECRAHKNAIFIGNEEPPFRPCCWFKNPIDANSYEEYQQKLSQLDVEENCRYCIETESNGGTWSHRMNYMDLENENFITVSISFDNLCNLKCITCSPTNSSQLATEIKNSTQKKIYTSIHKKRPIKAEFLKKMLSDANSVTHRTINLEILGGEPLINPVVYDFLDWLIEQPYAPMAQVNLTTNGTTFDDRILKYIKYFRKFLLQLSIDGIENTFEYVRFGAKFSTLEQVTSKFYELLTLYPEKFAISMNYTLTWMNSLHIKEFFNWVNINYPKINHILVTKLEWPFEYAINILPIELRKQIVEEVSKLTTDSNSKGVQSGLKYYKQHMFNTPDNTRLRYTIQTGINTLNRNDKLINRNSDFNKTFKPMIDLLKTNNII